MSDALLKRFQAFHREGGCQPYVDACILCQIESRLKPVPTQALRRFTRQLFKTTTGRKEDDMLSDQKEFPEAHQRDLDRLARALKRFRML